MTQTLIVCRKASEPRRGGSVLGYKCRVCGEELQVSPPGVVQIAGGGWPLCNPCGFAAAEEAQNLGVLAGTKWNPEAEKQLVERVLARRRN